jgi:tRNA U38,U39,U40 pseudouridine synthase TruA
MVVDLKKLLEKIYKARRVRLPRMTEAARTDKGVRPNMATGGTER